MEIDTSSTKGVTDALKGMAIIIVMVNHFINISVSSRWTGYANGVISLFFIFSGYSMYFVFEKNTKFHIQAVAAFWVNRFLRIYPLFWISMYALQVFNPKQLFFMDFFVPNFKVLIVYWFINALIQCYLIAPFFYMGLKKIGSTGFIITIISMVILINVSSFSATLTNEPLFFKYKFLLMIHLLLFATGMVLPMIIESCDLYKLKSNVMLWASLIVFLAMIFLTRRKEMLFSNSYVLFVPLFYLSASWFCLIILNRNPSLTFEKFFENIGTCSYSLFLFHLIYFCLIGKLVASINFPSGGFTIAIIAVVLSPLFFMFCKYSEKILLKLVSAATCHISKNATFIIKRSYQIFNVDR